MKNALRMLALGVVVSMVACVQINENNNKSNNGNNTGGTTQSGVSGNTAAKDFTPQQETDFCEYVASKSAGAAGTYQCTFMGESIELELEALSKAECQTELAKFPNCPVSSLEDCFDIIYDNDPCVVFSEEPPAACAALQTSACGGGAVNNVNNVNNLNNVNNVNNVNNGSYCEVNVCSICYDFNCNGDIAQGCHADQQSYCDDICNSTTCVELTDQSCFEDCME